VLAFDIAFPCQAAEKIAYTMEQGENLECKRRPSSFKGMAVVFIAVNVAMPCRAWLCNVCDFVQAAPKQASEIILPQ